MSTITEWHRVRAVLVTLGVSKTWLRNLTLKDKRDIVEQHNDSTALIHSLGTTVPRDLQVGMLDHRERIAGTLPDLPRIVTSARDGVRRNMHGDVPAPGGQVIPFERPEDDYMECAGGCGTKLPKEKLYAGEAWCPDCAAKNGDGRSAAIREYHRWLDEQFPNRSVESTYNKLFEEMDELRAAIELGVPIGIQAECVDVVLVIEDLFHLAGVDLSTSCKVKIETVQRKYKDGTWPKPGDPLLEES